MRFDNRSRWWLAAIVFGLIRIIALAIEYPALNADPDAYRALAEGWSASGTFGRMSNEATVVATAYRPPFYPWLLSWFVGADGLRLPAVATIHILLGSLTCWLTWDVARRLAESSNTAQHKVDSTLVHQTATNATAIAWFAGLTVALDPILIRQSSLVMTETAATFLSVSIWWVWVLAVQSSNLVLPRFALMVGALLGLSCLLRSSSLVWCPLLIVALVIHRWRVPATEPRSAFPFMSAFVLLLATTLVLIPWAIRNRIAMGSTIWATTHGGYTLLLANNPILFRHYEIEGGSRKWDEDRFHQLWSNRTQRDPRETAYWDEPNNETRAAVKIVDEVEDNRLANQTAWATIFRSPWTFAKACVIRIVWFWAIWPAPGQASLYLSILIGCWYSILFVLFLWGSVPGLAGWWSRRISASTSLAWLPAATLIVGLTLIHAVYWSNMRMRAPLIPIVAVIAAMSAVSHLPRELARFVSWRFRSGKERFQ